MNRKKTKGKILPFTGSFAGNKKKLQKAEPSCCEKQDAGKTETQTPCGMSDATSPSAPQHHVELTLGEPWSEDAWQASLAGVESDLVSELFGDNDFTPKGQEVTVEEMQWLLNRSADPEAVDSLPSQNEAEETIFGLLPEQLAEAQKNGTLTNLLEFRTKKSTQYPVLEKVMSIFCSGMAKRLHKLSGVQYDVAPVRCTKAPFDVWLRLGDPVASTFSMFPLEGTGVLGMDSELANAVVHNLFSAGKYETLDSQQKHTGSFIESNSQPDFPVSTSIARYLLHLLLLDLEWALAPFYEVESFGSKPTEPVRYSKHFWLDDPCIICELAVSVASEETSSTAGVSGTMMVVFPEKMLEAILPILTGDQEIIVPPLQEIDTTTIESFSKLPDGELLELLSAQHPLSAAVILSELSDDRRSDLIDAMPAEKQEDITRRMGHRAGVEQVLTDSQQFVASVLALGEAHAAQVLSSFSPEAAAGFLREASKLPSLYAEQVTALLKSRNSTITSAGALVVDSALVRRLMIRAIAPEQMHRVVSLCRNDRIYMPFVSVVSRPMKDIAPVLQGETLAVQRAVLQLLLATDREYAGQLFASFGLEEQSRIAEQLVHAKKISPELITVLENSFLAQLPETDSKESLALPPKERWAVSGTVEWLLEQYFVE